MIDDAIGEILEQSTKMRVGTRLMEPFHSTANQYSQHVPRSNIMKSILSSLVACFALLAISSSAAFAQSASVTASATIVTPITAAATAPLAFGTIAKGATATISATGSNAGAVTFSGDEADNITISVPATCTITTTSGAGASMTVTLNRAALRVNTTSAQGTAVSLDASSGSATTALSADGSGDGVSSDGLGQAYVWIGGSVTPTAVQQRGSYSGSFTVSAAYSN